MSKDKKNKGITLVALIVTIIVLLVLAGISIAMIKNSNLLDKTKLANEKYKNAENDEISIIDSYSNEIGKSSIESKRQTEEDFSKKYQRLRSDKYIDVDITQKFTAPTDGYLIVSSDVSNKASGNYMFMIFHYLKDGTEIESANTGGYFYMHNGGTNMYMKKGEYAIFDKQSNVTLIYARFWYAEGEQP